MISQQEEKGVIVAIDADNLLISSAEAGQAFEGYEGPEVGFENMFNWIKTFGKILCVHIYISAFQSINDSIWNVLWEKYKDEFLIETIYCPRKRPSTPKEKWDNVDAHLIEHSKRMVKLFGFQVNYFCLGAGDLDYSSLLCEFRRKGIEIAFELGSKASFSRAYRQMKIMGTHPKTGEELIHVFLPRKIQS